MHPLEVPVVNPYREEDNKVAVGNRIIASLEDQWTLVGVRRSGKSTFARELIARLRDAYPAMRTYILDSSNDKDFRKFAGVHIESEQAPAPLAQAGAVQIWRPPVDDNDEYDHWFMSILRKEQPALILIDELSSLGGLHARSFPRGYHLLSKQGGKHGVSMISCTQEAAYIPRVTIGQTTHLVRFRLLDKHDARKVDKLLRRPENEYGADPPDRYGFFYRRTDSDGGPHYYRSYQEFFKE